MLWWKIGLFLTLGLKLKRHVPAGWENDVFPECMKTVNKEVKPFLCCKVRTCCVCMDFVGCFSFLPQQSQSAWLHQNLISQQIFIPLWSLPSWQSNIFVPHLLISGINEAETIFVEMLRGGRKLIFWMDKIFFSLRRIENSRAESSNWNSWKWRAKMWEIVPLQQHGKRHQ